MPAARIPNPDLLPPRIREKLCVLTGNCWLWKPQHSGSGNGYGKISVNGKMQMAHRVVYEHFRGPVPEGKVLDHLCRNRACCNPDHLEPVTIQENTLRGGARLFAPSSPCPTASAPC